MVCLHSEGLVTLFLHLRHCFVNCFPDITCFIILNCVTNILGSGQFIFGSHVCIHDVLRLRYSDWCLKDDLKTLKSAKSLFVNLQFYLLIVRSNCILVTLRPISLTVLESQGGSSLHLLPTAFDVERQAPGTFLQSIKFIKHLFLDMICLPWISKSQKSRHSRRHSYLLQAPAGGISPGLHRLQGPRLRHTVNFRTNLTNRCYRSYLLSH